MAPIRFSLISTFDILAGVLLLFTESAVPSSFAQMHASFLIFKGVITQFPIPPIPPLFALGSIADVVSAAIIYTGNPPVLGGYKELIALFLLQKGLFGFFALLS